MKKLSFEKAKKKLKHKKHNQEFLGGILVLLTSTA